MRKDFQINIGEESIGAVTGVMWVVNFIQRVGFFAVTVFSNGF